jgi:phenylacetic acid degradation operon negative regulatory protein
MKPKTELFLYHLLWHLELLSRPTFRNLTDSYEAWAYRRGFLKQIRRLETHGLLERGSDVRCEAYRLSEAGRLAALGGRDPDQAWDRPWDGLWRIFVFDVPVDHDSERTRLRRSLRRSGFGYLQDSVWISPDAIRDDLRDRIRQVGGVEFLTQFTAQTPNAGTDQALARASWPFDKVRHCHERCLEVLTAFPCARPGTSISRETLLAWADAEHAAWRRALEFDPLLPSPLLPVDYLGREVWRRRREVFAQAGKAARDLDQIQVLNQA